MMNRDPLWQLGLFVVALIVLNSLFALHISILGSLALTVALSLAFSAFDRR